MTPGEIAEETVQEFPLPRPDKDPKWKPCIECNGSCDEGENCPLNHES